MQRNKKHRYFRKSREGRFLVVCAAASLCRTGTNVSDHFCGNRCGNQCGTLIDELGAVRVAIGRVIYFSRISRSDREAYAVKGFAGVCSLRCQ
jgi:hypothetical protein